ncbi:MAG: phosphoglucomutase/phosphomannomutase family protein, partial [Candidatus Aerophobetes bacterium]|nr:phosphoglucomutase/phosphomannomutase family protein [Candidatus Aerophobetes bacterium]
MSEIKFGTDGWRGVIADNFTFANVAKVAQAVADYYRIYENKEKALVIGYDARFLSKEFAQVVAEVLAGNDFHIVLSSEDLPTQAISFAISSTHLGGGIMLTASHNPPQFNGIKIRSSSGASVLPEVTAKIESFLGKNKIKRVNLEEAERKKMIIKRDLTLSYIKKVESFLDSDLLKRAHLKVIYDPMFGAGDGITQKILAKSNCEVITINPKYNPGFGGLNPEPIEENLEDLKKRVAEERADLGIATDGDGDRVGIVDDKGRYLTPHQVFSLLLLYLVRERKMRGGVVKTAS